MLALDDLKTRFAARVRSRGLRHRLEIIGEGLVLGADTLLTKQAAAGEEARILTLLSVVYRRAASPQILDTIRKALGMWSRGEKCLAQVYLGYARLPPLKSEEQAFALFAADELLKAGLGPRALMNGLGFDPAPLDLLKKYNRDQPRVQAGNGRESGQWTSGGGAGDGGRQYAQSDEPPPLKRIHPDSTYESDQAAKGSLQYWRKQSTDQIIESLKPGNKNPLTVKPDGSVFDGNTRLKILEERGVSVNTLPRKLYEDLDTGLRGGGSGRFRELPTEE